MPGVQVTLTNVETGLKREVETEGTGIYRATDLPGGHYTIDASAGGFKTVRKTGVTVTIGQVNNQDIQLSVGAATQEVTVSASAVALQTEKGRRSHGDRRARDSEPAAERIW